jgi:hypothetical protein
VVAHRVVDAIEVWERIEDVRRNVVEHAALEPAHRHADLDIGDVEVCAAEERLAGDSST